MLFGCGPGNLTNYNPARYGTVRVWIDSAFTANQVPPIERSMNAAQVVGPAIVRATSQSESDVAIMRGPDTECIVAYDRAMNIITVPNGCFQFRPDNPVVPPANRVMIAVMMRWLGNRPICRTDMARPTSCILICSPIGEGIAASNAWCYSGNQERFDASYNAVDEPTSLDIAEYRANHL